MKNLLIWCTYLAVLFAGARIGVAVTHDWLGFHHPVAMLIAVAISCAAFAGAAFIHMWLHERFGFPIMDKWEDYTRR